MESYGIGGQRRYGDGILPTQLDRSYSSRIVYDADYCYHSKQTYHSITEISSIFSVSMSIFYIRISALMRWTHKYLPKP